MSPRTAARSWSTSCHVNRRAIQPARSARRSRRRSRRIAGRVPWNSRLSSSTRTRRAGHMRSGLMVSSSSSAPFTTGSGSPARRRAVRRRRSCRARVVPLWGRCVSSSARSAFVPGARRLRESTHSMSSTRIEPPPLRALEDRSRAPPPARSPRDRRAAGRPRCTRSHATCGRQRTPVWCDADRPVPRPAWPGHRDVQLADRPLPQAEETRAGSPAQKRIVAAGEDRRPEPPALAERRAADGVHAAVLHAETVLLQPALPGARREAERGQLPQRDDAVLRPGEPCQMPFVPTVRRLTPSLVAKRLTIVGRGLHAAYRAP